MESMKDAQGPMMSPDFQKQILQLLPNYDQPLALESVKLTAADLIHLITIHSQLSVEPEIETPREVNGYWLGDEALGEAFDNDDISHARLTRLVRLGLVRFDVRRSSAAAFYIKGGKVCCNEKVATLFLTPLSIDGVLIPADFMSVQTLLQFGREKGMFTSDQLRDAVRLAQVSHLYEYLEGGMQVDRPDLDLSERGADIEGALTGLLLAHPFATVKGALELITTDMGDTHDGHVHTINCLVELIQHAADVPGFGEEEIDMSDCFRYEPFLEMLAKIMQVHPDVLLTGGQVSAQQLPRAPTAPKAVPGMPKRILH